MMESPTPSIPLWAKFGLIMGGIALALLLILGLLLLFPDWFTDSQEPYERQEAGTSFRIEYHISDGDLFANMPGRIRPIPPEEDALLAAFTVSWDQDGFREPLLKADTYPIAALGDSFTEAVIIEKPWSDRVAEKLGVPIYNYGYRAYGPLEMERVAREFVTAEPRTWILYAFFAGNDLYDVTRKFSAQERNPLNLLGQSIEQAQENAQAEIAPPDDTHYDFPLPVIIGGNYYEMAFLAEFLWAQRTPEQGFAASYNFQILRNVLAEIQRAAGSETCLALIFIPTKEQLYYPYIYDTERQWIREIGQKQVLDENRHLQMEPNPIPLEDEAAFIAQTTGQRDAVAALAEELGWRFIDLLPAFQAAVAQGQVLYYPYDSHWNPDGHELASQVIAEYLEHTPECELTLDG
jgi:hypothetical protein